MEITAKYKIPHFFGFGATEVVNEKFASDPEKYGYWMIKGWPSTYKLTPCLRELEDAITPARTSPKNKTVTIYGEDTDLGRSLGNGIKPQFVDAGWTVVAEFFDIAQTEFYPLLNKIKDEPGAGHGHQHGATFVLGLHQAGGRGGLKSLIIADGLGWVGEWYSLTGSSSNYVWTRFRRAQRMRARSTRRISARWSLEPSPSAAGLAYDGATS